MHIRPLVFGPKLSGIVDPTQPISSLTPIIHPVRLAVQYWTLGLAFEAYCGASRLQDHLALFCCRSPLGILGVRGGWCQEYWVNRIVLGKPHIVCIDWAFQMERTDPTVKMHDQADSQATIKDRVATSRREECCGGYWNETC